MERMRLGKTGMMVSKLGFGGIPIQRLTQDEAVGGFGFPSFGHTSIVST